MEIKAGKDRQKVQAQAIKRGLFTEWEIPDYHTMVAVNCFNAKIPCDSRMSSKCRNMNPEMWRKCPRQTKIAYKHKEKFND